MHTAVGSQYTRLLAQLKESVIRTPFVNPRERGLNKSTPQPYHAVGNDDNRILILTL